MNTEQIKVKFVTIDKKKLIVASQFIVSYFLIPPARTPCIILSKLLVYGFFNESQNIK